MVPSVVDRPRNAARWIYSFTPRRGKGHPVRIAFWFNWLLLISLGIGLALSLADFRSATHYASAPLLLEPGTQLTLETERLLPGRPQLSLTFQRPPRDYDHPDPVLGDWQNSKHAGFLRFRTPGEPIRLKVEYDGRHALYRAMPVSSHGSGEVTRKFTPDEPGMPPSDFRWPPLASPLTLGAGTLHLKITVVDVGPGLRGETATLGLAPGLQVKVSDADYGWLWLLFLVGTPLKLLLALYAVLMLAWSWRRVRALRRGRAGAVKNS